MRLSPSLSALCLLSLALASGVSDRALAACGGNFGGFVAGLRDEAVRRGHDAGAVRNFFSGVRQDPAVIRADRAQGVFQRDFIDFARRLISRSRLDNGQRNAGRYSAVFDEIERRYGVSRGVLLAFWALETDFGAVQGDFNTRDALVTLAHDCRRPELFRPQIFSALTLYERGDFDPARTTGAWAGEIGQVQMLPADILENGVDGDGDGHVRLKASAPDALMSAGRMLKGLGWRANEPWLQEIVIPGNLDWAETGLDHGKRVSDWARLGVRPRSGSLGPGNLHASVLLPMGRNGPAFLAYPNFRVFFEWNQSLVYVTTAAYLATRFEGAPIFDPRAPDPGLAGAEMKALQRKLVGRGHDVGGVDGILGEKTREAVQKEQIRLGFPADSWPTRALLDRL
ncbi:lytic murein transglycosylase [Rhodovulum sulfidophilum]|uniref:lytic murein transglycosylase n=1 Tax=Rhodovulum sulfidophilum TaxID=35806 RepID=UPI0013893F67|nr:lytic murein transglycosylase [Rhodovulum sulfidophilum]NDK34630.1 lytic murein transglycosylase [Rhodovulum sulfidophilum]